MPRPASRRCSEEPTLSSRTSSKRSRRRTRSFLALSPAGLMARIAADLRLPYCTGDYLEDAPLVDSGPMAETSLDPSTPACRLNAAAAVIGPATVSALFDQFIAIDDQLKALSRYHQDLSNAHSRLRGAIAATRQEVFVPVLAARAQTDNPRRIGLMADLLARHGGDSGDSKPPIGTAHRATLRISVEGWIATLRAAPSPVRHASSEVVRAAARLAGRKLGRTSTPPFWSAT